MTGRTSRCIMHLGQWWWMVSNTIHCINETHFSVNSHCVTHVTNHVTKRVNALEREEKRTHNMSVASTATRTMMIHCRRSPRWQTEILAQDTMCQMIHMDTVSVQTSRRI